MTYIEDGAAVAFYGVLKDFFGRNIKTLKEKKYVKIMKLKLDSA